MVHMHVQSQPLKEGVCLLELFERINTSLVIVMTFLVRECYGSPEKHENSLKFALKNVLTRC